jgi:hypothetical protein
MVTKDEADAILREWGFPENSIRNIDTIAVAESIIPEPYSRLGQPLMATVSGAPRAKRQGPEPYSRLGQPPEVQDDILPAAPSAIVPSGPDIAGMTDSELLEAYLETSRAGMAWAGVPITRSQIENALGDRGYSSDEKNYFLAGVILPKDGTPAVPGTFIYNNPDYVHRPIGQPNPTLSPGFTGQYIDAGNEPNPTLSPGFTGLGDGSGGGGGDFNALELLAASLDGGNVGETGPVGNLGEAPLTRFLRRRGVGDDGIGLHSRAGQFISNQFPEIQNLFNTNRDIRAAGGRAVDNFTIDEFAPQFQNARDRAGFGSTVLSDLFGLTSGQRAEFGLAFNPSTDEFGAPIDDPGAKSLGYLQRLISQGATSRFGRRGANFAASRLPALRESFNLNAPGGTWVDYLKTRLGL